VDDVSQRPTSDLLNECVHVVWHDRPRQLHISFAVEMPKGILDHRRYRRIAKRTASKTTVDGAFNLFAKIGAIGSPCPERIRDGSQRLSAAPSPAGIFEAMQQHLGTLVGRKVLLFDSLGTLEAKSERLALGSESAKRNVMN
jgi:hypothetical protein